MNAMLFGIQFFGQTIYKSVPDSLICITPQQDIFFITQSFTIKELQSTLVLRNKTISILNEESKYLRLEVAEKKTEIDLRIYKEDNYKADINILSKKLKKSDRKTRFIKGLAVGLAIFAVAELSYISVSAIKR